MSEKTKIDECRSDFIKDKMKKPVSNRDKLLKIFNKSEQKIDSIRNGNPCLTQYNEACKILKYQGFTRRFKNKIEAANFFVIDGDTQYKRRNKNKEINRMINIYYDIIIISQLIEYFELSSELSYVDNIKEVGVDERNFYTIGGPEFPESKIYDKKKYLKTLKENEDYDREKYINILGEKEKLMKIYNEFYDEFGFYFWEQGKYKKQLEKRFPLSEKFNQLRIVDIDKLSVIENNSNLSASEIENFIGFYSIESGKGIDPKNYPNKQHLRQEPFVPIGNSKFLYNDKLLEEAIRYFICHSLLLGKWNKNNKKNEDKLEFKKRLDFDFEKIVQDTIKEDTNCKIRTNFEALPSDSGNNKEIDAVLYDKENESLKVVEVKFFRYYNSARRIRNRDEMGLNQAEKSIESIKNNLDFVKNKIGIDGNIENFDKLVVHPHWSHFASNHHSIEVLEIENDEFTLKNEPDFY